MNYIFSFHEFVPAREEVSHGLVIGRHKFFPRVRQVRATTRRHVVPLRGPNDWIGFFNRPEVHELLDGLFERVHMKRLESADPVPPPPPPPPTRYVREGKA